MGMKFDKVTERLNEMDQKIDSEVLDINNEIAAVNKQFTSAMLEVKNELDAELRILHGKFDGLSNINNNMGNSFELSVNGIPKSDGENLESAKISSVIKFEMEKSIVDIHRLTHAHQASRSPNANTNVIICFDTKQNRRLFLSKYLSFIKAEPLKLSHIEIDSQSRIFVNENISKECLGLLKKAKMLKKAGKLASAYTYDGQVCVHQRETDEKFQIVSSYDDLKKYE